MSQDNANGAAAAPTSNFLRQIIDGDLTQGTYAGRKDTKGQNPAEQVRVKRADRVRLIKMDATIEAPSAPKTPEGGQA